MSIVQIESIFDRARAMVYKASSSGLEVTAIGNPPKAVLAFGPNVCVSVALDVREGENGGPKTARISVQSTCVHGLRASVSVWSDNAEEMDPAREMAERVRVEFEGRELLMLLSLALSGYSWICERCHEIIDATILSGEEESGEEEN